MPRSARRKPKTPAKRVAKSGRSRPLVIACFGERCLRARVVKQSAGVNLDPSVTLSLAAADLATDPADLSAPLRVYRSGTLSEPADRTFTGYVKGMERDARNRWLVNASSMAVLEERRTGGLGVASGTAVPEVFWMTSRAGGLPPQDILIHGWNPQRSRYLVVIPVEGIVPHGQIDAGLVGLTVDPKPAQRFAGLGPPELFPAFLEPAFWAVTVVSEMRMYEAEQAGIRAVDRVLGRLALAARYSLTETPGGVQRPFRRQRWQEQLRLRPIVGVEQLDLGGKWLRGYAHDYVVTPLDSGLLEGLEADVGAADERLDDAISGWRRAASQTDPAVAVVALSEAIEFYAAGVQVPHLFSDVERDAIRDAASVGLTGMRLERIKQLAGNLNDAPLSARLRAALKADRVHYSDAEFSLLAKFRGLRRAILHGESRKVPSEDELRQALALVNRMIMFRLHRLSEERRAPD